MELAVVYPVYNEVEYLEDAARKTKKKLEQLEVENYQIVFISDGSTDGTQEKADKLEENIEEVNHLNYNQRLGKGGAFEKAFEKTDAEKYAYCDVDLSTDLKHITEGLNHLEDYEIAVGSRRKSGEVIRDRQREIPSLMFNSMMKVVFRSEIDDHQCGFKFFRKEALEKLKTSVDNEHWFWDAEILVRAQNKGYDVKEFPVNWENRGESKVEVKKDSIYFLKKIVELRRQLWSERS